LPASTLADQRRQHLAVIRTRRHPHDDVIKVLAIDPRHRANHRERHTPIAAHLSQNYPLQKPPDLIGPPQHTRLRK
jgi:hypothetical protein